MTKYNILGLIANHTSNNIKYNISLNNISLIKKYLKDIIIIDSKNKSYAEDLKFELKDENKIKEYLFTQNNNCYDFGKWIFVLENFDYTEYDYILFLNDSIILTENIDDYFYYIENVTDSINIYGYNDSMQNQYHYKSYCFLLNISIINKFIEFFYKNKKLIVNLDSLVNNIELYLHTIDDNRDCFLKIGNDYNMSKNLYWENEVLNQYLLSKNIFGIIKIKKIYDMQKEYKITIYGHNIENFNYDFYKTYYDDLNNLSDNELLNHFIEYGQYEGRRFMNNCNTFLSKYYTEKLNKLKLLYFFDIPDDFDIYYYKKYNDDIKYLSHIDTMLHYIEHGYYEGRTYNKVNSANFYLNCFYFNILNKFNNIYIYENDDLNNLNIYSYKIINEDINNYPYMSCLKHFLTEGKEHNLLSSKKDLDDILVNFNENLYKSINPHLNDLNYLELIKHYIYNNIINSYKYLYKLPSDFNHNIYKNIYSDLCNLSDDELSLHYISYGINEGRIYKIPDDFDPKIYRNIYNDLRNLSDEELKSHYLIYGYNEKRIYKIPDDFDCKTYKNIHTELLDLDDDKIKEHYLSNIEIKKKDNIIYELPHDFNPYLYKTIYNDLVKLTNEELKNHYLYYGINEKRVYKMPEDFDPIIYKELNDDLKNLNDGKLIEHYLVYGINENRKYKKN